MKYFLSIFLFLTALVSCNPSRDNPVKPEPYQTGNSGNIMLNNKWLLEKIGTTPINASDYNSVPVLEMDISKGRVTGNDGCNSLNGEMEVQGKRIKFSPIARTEMGCMKKDIGNILGAQISDKTVDYYIKEDRLFMSLEDKSLLVFKKF